MTTLIALEVEKIVRRRLNQIILAVMLGLLVVMYVLLWLASDVVAEAGVDFAQVANLRSALFLEETVPFAMLMLYFFGFVGGVVAIGSSVGSEYSWNTIRTLVSIRATRVPRRNDFATSTARS